jgi:hypothetical protein
VRRVAMRARPSSGGGQGDPGKLNWGAEKVLNLGGTQEVKGAVDFNIESGTYTRTPHPQGLLIQGDYTEPWPLPDNFLDKVVGNRMAAHRREPLQRMANEAYRTLKPGGTVAVFTSSVGGGLQEDWVRAFRNAGFQNVKLVGGRRISAVK